MTAASLFSWQTWSQVSSGTELPWPWLFYQPGTLLKPSYALLYSYLHSPSVTLWSCLHCVTQTNSCTEKNISRTGCYVLFSLFNWLRLLRKNILEHWNQTGVWITNPVAEFPWKLLWRQRLFVRPKRVDLPFIEHQCSCLLALKWQGFNLLLFEATHLWWPSKQALNLTRHSVSMHQVKRLEPNGCN